MSLHRKIQIGNPLEPAKHVTLEVPAEFSASELMDGLRDQYAQATKGQGGLVTGLSGEPGAFALAVAIAEHFERQDKRIKELEERVDELKEIADLAQSMMENGGLSLPGGDEES